MSIFHQMWKQLRRSGAGTESRNKRMKDYKKELQEIISQIDTAKNRLAEKTMRKNDLLFCGAPHLFIAHEKCVGKWAEDSKVNCNIATAYFELLCNAHGLGTTIMSYSAEVLNELAPKARDMLGIPREHYTGLIVGFGYPEIQYARGVQKDRSAKTHRYSVDHGKR